MCINQSEHNYISTNGTQIIYSINYMFRPLHWPSSGLYLTYQETVQSVWRALGRRWGGTRSCFTIVASMKIRTLDRITNIWCQYRDLKCLMTCNHSMLQKTASTACWVAWRSPIGPIALCMVSDESGGSTCIIKLRLLYCWSLSLWVRRMFLVARLV
jgi:hypothetical protein